MEKPINTEEQIKTSVSSIYSQLISKRKEEEKIRKQQKEEEKAIREAEKEEEVKEKLSKKEKQKAAMENWQGILVGLTGDDLEYSDKKKSRKKKYKKWIDDDETSINTMKDKPKKVKKKNYNKEFEPELNMLKSIVADQNKFTVELLKRFQNAAGPATKDAAPLNKSLVDLATAINTSRSNSLGMLREIGGLKKTIAELYMKQKKLDSEVSSGTAFVDNTDLGLMGSSIASSMFGDNSGIMSSQIQPSAYPGSTTPIQNNITINQSQQAAGVIPVDTPINVSATPIVNQSQGYESFDPSTWDGGPSVDSSIMFEKVPHTVVVEWHKEENKARFKAVDNDGQELIGCPVPTADPNKLIFNEQDKTVKGQFDEIYKLEIV
jgi:hypothetical protein